MPLSATLGTNPRLLRLDAKRDQDCAPRGLADLRKYQDYLRHAAECREMARTTPSFHRAQLEQMAEVWDDLAEARKRKLEKLGISPNDDTAEIE